MEIEYVRDPGSERTPTPSLTERVYALAMHVMLLCVVAACIMLSLAAVFVAYWLVSSAWGLL